MIKTENKYLHKLLLIFLAFLGCQRFVLPSFYSFVCIIPFVFFLLKNHNLNYLIISLFLCVDNGAGVYSSSLGILRYGIIFISLFFLIKNANFSKERINIYLLIVTFFLFITLLSFLRSIPFNVNQLIRDLEILLFFGLAFCTSISTNKTYIKIHELSFFFIWFAFFEIINIIRYSNWPYLHYLSYDSSKSLIAIPIIYLFFKQRYLKLIPIFVPIFVVLIFYGSRIIILSLIILLLLYGLIRFVLKHKRNFFKAFFVFSLFVFLINYTRTNFKHIFDSNRILHSIDNLFTHTSLSKLLISLDKVRFYEYKLFFERDIFTILFGSGLGTGIEDKKNYFSFVKTNQYAFHDFELQSKLFFNFHDFFTDIGLRFGLVAVLMLFIIVIRYFYSSNPEKELFSFLALFLLINCFYSLKGIYIIVIFLLIWKSTQKSRTVDI
ncbi:O-antigen ligase family protein [Aestuariivivens sp. NBU2969]|uniref:O-antigen ligase family protein n=1 Tax=Aestuariivivens sp. NBU2969 TaxID=2873267 RepID=UPI001CBDFD46|nr:O-antigen ligase family protein [Aestuariivivens sp. NBU2969]